MPSDTADQVAGVLVTLRRLATKHTRDSLPRFGIVADGALGVSVADLRKVAKQLGRDHDLALALWDTGVYDARMLAPFVGEPARMTPAQMDRWCRDFDNWAVCDAACFHLFDKTPHAFRKVEQWSGRKPEFVKRAAFALLASVALHDKKREDEPFARCLPLIDAAADDGRNFVKKGVSWALRGVGRRSVALHTASVDLARRLAESGDAARRWVGKDALRELTSPAVTRKVAAKAR